MLKLAADENVKRQIVSGLRRRSARLDIVTVREATIDGSPDPEVLVWAASEERVLITHDTRTMGIHAYARMETGETMPGVIEIPASMPIGRAIDDLLLIVELTEPDEVRNRVLRLPL